MYRRIGELLYRLLKPLWRLKLGGKVRARVLLLHTDEVLLVKNWIGHQWWTLAGGGRKRGEDFAQAAVREVKEELGIRISPSELFYLSKLENDDRVVKHPVEVFVMEFKKKPSFSAHRPEIIEARWFPVDSLPAHINPLVEEAISDYRKA